MQLWYYCKLSFNWLCKIPLETFTSIQGFRLHIHFCFKNVRWLYLPDMHISEMESTGLWWAHFQESKMTHSRSTAQMCSSEILEGDWSQTASFSSMLPARQLHSTLRQNDPSTRSCNAQGVLRLSSLWVEFPGSPTQICVTCFIPCLQLVEAATICISHASLISPSLVYGHYHQDYFNWKENLQITCQQLSSAGERSITTHLHLNLDTWNHFTYFTVLAFLLTSWKLLYGSFNVATHSGTE